MSQYSPEAQSLDVADLLVKAMWRSKVNWEDGTIIPARGREGEVDAASAT
jgi:hypothetical protein